MTYLEKIAKLEEVFEKISRFNDENHVNMFGNKLELSLAFEVYKDSRYFNVGLVDIQIRSYENNGKLRNCDEIVYLDVDSFDTDLKLIAPRGLSDNDKITRSILRGLSGLTLGDLVNYYNADSDITEFTIGKNDHGSFDRYWLKLN